MENFEIELNFEGKKNLVYIESSIITFEDLKPIVSKMYYIDQKLIFFKVIKILNLILYIYYNKDISDNLFISDMKIRDELMIINKLRFINEVIISLIFLNQIISFNQIIIFNKGFQN